MGGAKNIVRDKRSITMNSDIFKKTPLPSVNLGWGVLKKGRRQIEKSTSAEIQSCRSHSLRGANKEKEGGSRGGIRGADISRFGGTLGAQSGDEHGKTSC